MDTPEISLPVLPPDPVHHRKDVLAGKADIRHRLSAHPLFNGLLIDAQGRTTAIIVRLSASAETDRRNAVLTIRKIADQFATEQKLDHVAVAGAPVLVVDGFVSLDRDNQTLGVVAMIVRASGSSAFDAGRAGAEVGVYSQRTSNSAAAPAIPALRSVRRLMRSVVGSKFGTGRRRATANGFGAGHSSPGF